MKTTMGQAETIAYQAQRILYLEREALSFRTAIHNARMLMIGIGGPLNDNTKKYTSDQLSTLYRIDEALQEVGVPQED